MIALKYFIFVFFHRKMRDFCCIKIGFPEVRINLSKREVILLQVTHSFVNNDSKHQESGFRNPDPV